MADVQHPLAEAVVPEFANKTRHRCRRHGAPFRALVAKRVPDHLRCRRRVSRAVAVRLRLRYGEKGVRYPFQGRSFRVLFVHGKSAGGWMWAGWFTTR